MLRDVGAHARALQHQMIVLIAQTHAQHHAITNAAMDVGAIVRMFAVNHVEMPAVLTAQASAKALVVTRVATDAALGVLESAAVRAVWSAAIIVKQHVAVHAAVSVLDNVHLHARGHVKIPAQELVLVVATLHVLDNVAVAVPVNVPQAANRAVKEDAPIIAIQHVKEGAMTLATEVASIHVPMNATLYVVTVLVPEAV